MNFADGTELSCLKKQQQNRKDELWSEGRGSWGSGVRVPGSSRSSSLDSIIQSQSLVFEVPQPQSFTSLLFFNALPSKQTRELLSATADWERETRLSFLGRSATPRSGLATPPTVSWWKWLVGNIVRFFFAFEILMFSLLHWTFLHRWDHIFRQRGGWIGGEASPGGNKGKQLGSTFLFVLLLKKRNSKKRTNRKKYKEQIFCVCCLPQSRKCEGWLHPPTTSLKKILKKLPPPKKKQLYLQWVFKFQIFNFHLKKNYFCCGFCFPFFFLLYLVQKMWNSRSPDITTAVLEGSQSTSVYLYVFHCII